GGGLRALRPARPPPGRPGARRGGANPVPPPARAAPPPRLRDLVQRRAREDVLVKAAELARAHRFKRLKLYMMVGLPTETEEDIDELVAFSLELSKIIPLSLGIAPFCAKRNTPLDGAPYAGIKTVERRLKRLRKGVKGRVDLRATSARWAWVEYVLAQGGAAEGRAVLDAVHAGGRFRDWERAFTALPEDRPRRAIVRPSDRIDRRSTQRAKAKAGLPVVA
ncbi:MAG: hypothetical protein AAF447_18750, partial [Myxococcota bacterium]